MGNSFGFLRTEGGFQFTVLDSCKAEGIDLNQTCSLAFDTGGRLISIGNTTRGTMKPEPGIAGIGIWLAFMAFFFVVLVALLFILIEIATRSHRLQSSLFAVFKDNKVNDPGSRDRKLDLGDKLRAAGRTFVLGIADTQTVFVGAFLLGFAGRAKCSLTSYHFTVAVDQMMIALSAITFSVALVRTYWRNPLAAALRSLLALGTFTGVGLTIFRKANFAPDYPPAENHADSAILLPVACLLESTLRLRAQDQAKQSQGSLGFGDSVSWPIERGLFISVSVAFLLAHVSILVRFGESKQRAPGKWRDVRRLFTLAYWPLILIPPTVTSLWCWVRVFQARNWVNKSGWIGNPNTEMAIWDAGQLFALGVLITVVTNILTELWKRDDKDTIRKVARRSDGQRLLQEHAGGHVSRSDPQSFSMSSFGNSTHYGSYRPIPNPHNLR